MSDQFALTKTPTKTAVERLSTLVETQRALIESEARKAAILESALDAIVTIDRHGLICEFNKAAEKMFGRERQEVMGKEIAQFLIPPALRDNHRRALTS